MISVHFSYFSAYCKIINTTLHWKYIFLSFSFHKHSSIYILSVIESESSRTFAVLITHYPILLSSNILYQKTNLKNFFTKNNKNKSINESFVYSWLSQHSSDYYHRCCRWTQQNLATGKKRYFPKSQLLLIHEQCWNDCRILQCNFQHLNSAIWTWYLLIQWITLPQSLYRKRRPVKETTTVRRNVHDIRMGVTKFQEMTGIKTRQVHTKRINKCAMFAILTNYF